MSEVERLAALDRLKVLREQEKKESEAKSEAAQRAEETKKRIDEAVAARVEEELEKRRDEIEEEVGRRVEAAKKEMEAVMMAELEQMRVKHLAEEVKREVSSSEKSYLQNNNMTGVVICSASNMLERRSSYL